MGPRRAETVRLEQIETLVGRLGATETQVRMTVFPTVWPKSFRGHAAVRGVAGERDRTNPTAHRRGHGADLVAGGSCGDAGGRNLHAPAAHCLATASDQSRRRARGRRLTQAGDPARLACMPVIGQHDRIRGEFINSSQPIRKEHTEAAPPPAPAVALALGAATAAPERLWLKPRSWRRSCRSAVLELLPVCHSSA